MQHASLLSGLRIQKNVKSDCNERIVKTKRTFGLFRRKGTKKKAVKKMPKTDIKRPPEIQVGMHVIEVISLLGDPHGRSSFQDFLNDIKKQHGSKLNIIGELSRDEL